MNSKTFENYVSDWNQFTDLEKIHWISQYILGYESISEYEDLTRRQRSDYEVPIIALYGNHYIRRGFGENVSKWNPIGDLNHVSIAESAFVNISSPSLYAYIESLHRIFELLHDCDNRTEITLRLHLASSTERSTALYVAYKMKEQGHFK